MNSKRIHLWDLPTRLFHWLLVLSVSAAIISAQIGGNLIEWHGKIGLFIVGLITFRLIWGLLGSTYARFAQFFPSPARVKDYLRGEWRGVGHNPLGAFSVFGLLGLLAFQDDAAPSSLASGPSMVPCGFFLVMNCSRETPSHMTSGLATSTDE
jgi:cytochrome b